MLIDGLYEVTKVTQGDGKINAHAKLNADHAVFKGHFPNKPVLPGVCSLQMVQEIIAEQFKKDVQLKRSSTIKFMAIIDPLENPGLDFDITTSDIEGGVKGVARISYNETLAVKLSAEFQFV